jgi:ribosome maturation protein SDO1
MSSGIFTPINQVRLTNVSVVRLKKGGRRFELACYKNKLLDYRRRVTTSLDQVLQVDRIFINVSKGQLASSEDIAGAFGPNTPHDAIVREILDRGELQISGKERSHQLDSLYREIATIVADKCVNPTTRLPYPVGVIEQAMADNLHYSVNPSRSAKQQALDVMKRLGGQPTFPITRAKMRLLIDLPATVSGSIQKKIEELIYRVEKRCMIGDHLQMECLIEPGSFRKITEIVSSTTKGIGSVHTVSLKEVGTADSDDEDPSL